MPDIIFDSSGNNGADGIDGKDGNSIFTRKNAKSAKNGVDAKDIDFTLSSVKGSKIPGHIHIRGTIEGKNDFQRIDKEYFLGSDGKVIFKARGGNGGKGGKGGNGQYNQSNYSYVGGGYGTNGGKAGDGGHIKITTNEEDAHLLMLLGKYDTKGGKGGKAGKHGMGFSGGNELFDGNHGKDGTFKYGIKTEDGQWIKKKEQTNSLKISYLEYEPQVESGIFEPGSTLNITNFKLENVGLDSTPKHTLIKIEIDPNDKNYKCIKNHYIYAPLFIKARTHEILSMSVNINDCEQIVDGEPLEESVELE